LKNIFVGNLSFGASEESVRALFETHGTVGRVNIVTDRDSGQPRGFGFVEMANDAEGLKAIAAINAGDNKVLEPTCICRFVKEPLLDPAFRMFAHAATLAG
jgi:RNA recognition motif-containing protein